MIAPSIHGATSAKSTKETVLFLLVLLALLYCCITSSCSTALDLFSLPPARPPQLLSWPHPPQLFSCRFDPIQLPIDPLREQLQPRLPLLSCLLLLFWRLLRCIHLRHLQGTCTKHTHHPPPLITTGNKASQKPQH